MFLCFKYEDSCKPCVDSWIIWLNLSQGVLCFFILTALCMRNTNLCHSVGNDAEEKQRLAHVFSFVSALGSPLTIWPQARVHKHTRTNV